MPVEIVGPGSRWCQKPRQASRMWYLGDLLIFSAAAAVPSNGQCGSLEELRVIEYPYDPEVFLIVGQNQPNPSMGANNSIGYRVGYV